MINWLHCHKKDHRNAGSGQDRFRVDVSMTAMTDNPGLLAVVKKTSSSDLISAAT